jgi:hypothetical protein
LTGPHLIVDDVLTTGGSMERLREERRKLLPPGTMVEPGNWIVGAVVFSRGQCPLWVSALFRMPECFWLKSKVRST